MGKKMALGKGIASLIQTNSVEALETEVIEQKPRAPLKEGDSKSREENIEQKDSGKGKVKDFAGPLLVDISQIVANKKQPRKVFKEEQLKELAQSIKENGIIQPLIVREIEEGFEVIAGERRLRAAQMAGVTKVPVVLKKATEKDRLVMAIIENVQRSDLNCVEEALAYFQLMEEFKLTQEEVAKKVGKDRSTIANFLRVLKLPRSILDLLNKELLSFGHAKVLAVIKDSEQAEKLGKEAAENNLSVRELEALIQNTRSPKERAHPKKIYNERLDQLRQYLEKRTGFHFVLAAKGSGSGTISIKFNNEEEFNKVYEFLLR